MAAGPAPGDGHRVLLGPLLWGLALRLALLLVAGDLDLHGDESSYTYLALSWNRFGFYGGAEHFLWPPLYPAFVALGLELFGAGGLTAVKLVQVAASGAVGASVMALAGAAGGGRRAARVAGCLWAGYLPLAAYTHYLWPETLFLALLLPAIVLFLGLLQRPAAPGAARLRPAAVGALLGLALLVKESAAPLAALLLLLVLARRSQGPLGLRLARAGLLAASLAAVVLPWTLRNAEVYGRFVPSGSTLGQNLYWGVNADYTNFDYPGTDYRELYGGGSIRLR